MDESHGLEAKQEESLIKENKQSTKVQEPDTRSIWQIRCQQLKLLLRYLYLLRIRHYLRLSVSILLLMLCVPANSWTYKIIESFILNTRAATGMLGVNLVDGSNYGTSSRLSLMAENTTDFAAIKATLLSRGVKPDVFSRCGTWPECRRQFLSRLHSTLLDKYSQTGLLDDKGNPVRAECTGGSSHALTCAYFLQLLMRPKVSTLSPGGAAFKDVGFLRYVVKHLKPLNGDSFDDFSSSGTDSSHTKSGDLPPIAPEYRPIPDTPCTRTHSHALFGAVSHFHSVLLLTALASLMLQADLFPLCSLRRAGFLRLMYFSGLEPVIAWLAACIWGLAECFAVALAVAVAYKCQCPGEALEPARFGLAFLAVTCSAVHYLACGLLAVSCGHFGYVVLSLLLVHLLSLAGSFVVAFVGSETTKAAVRLLLSVLLPGSQLNTFLFESAVPTSSGGKPNALRAENIGLLCAGFCASCLLAVAALYADTSSQAGPKVRGLGRRFICYPLQRLFASCRTAANVQVEPLPAEDVNPQKVEFADPSWEAIVQARRLTKAYCTGDQQQGAIGNSSCCCCRQNRTKNALDNFSANIYADQITALIGPNGSGKSTLIRLLAGDEMPTSGMACVLGKSVTDPIQRLRVAGRIGICYQENVLCESLTVWESVRAVLVSRGRDTPDQRAASRSLLNSLGLSGRLLNRPSTGLSGGQQRKVCAALALAGDPVMILLDEPSSGLDPLSRRSLWSALSHLKAGRCVLLSTQFMDEADLLADRKLLLGDGKLICAGSSLFIKGIYKCGCVAHVETEQPQELAKLIVSDLKDNIASSADSTDAKKEEVTAVVTAAKEVEVRAPREKLTQLAKWLEKEKSAEQGRISNFGLSLTGLDSVFQLTGEADDAAKAADTLDAAALETVAGSGSSSRELKQFSVMLQMNIRRLRRDGCRIACRLFMPSLLFAIFLAVLIVTRASMDSPPGPLVGLNSRMPLQFRPSEIFTSVSGVCLADVGATPPQETDCDKLLTGGIKSYVKDIKVLLKPADVSLTTFLSWPDTQAQFQKACSYALQCPLAYANDWSLAGGLGGNANRTVYFGFYFDEKEYTAMSNVVQLIKGYSTLAKHFGLQLRQIPDIDIDNFVEPADNLVPLKNASAYSMGAIIRNPLESSFYLDLPMWALLLLISVIPVSLLGDAIEDRSTGLRSQLRSMGVSALGYWCSTCLVHWLQYLLLCLPACVAMVIVLPQTYTNAYYIIGVFLVLLLIGLPVNQLIVYVASTWLRQSNAVATGILFVVCIACGLAPLLVQLNNFLGLALIVLWPPYAVIGLPFYASKAAANAAEFYGQAGPSGVYNLFQIYASNPLLLLSLASVLFHFCLLTGLLAARERGLRALLSAAVSQCCNSKERIRAACFRGLLRRWGPISNARDQPDSILMTRREADQLEIVGAQSDVFDEGVREETKRLISQKSTASSDTSGKGGSEDPVQVINLVKRYAGGYSPAVNGVTFGAQAGQIFGLLGPNGAGKSTTLSVLVGERSASGGRCLVNGLSGREAARLGRIGYCPQYSPLLPSITVLEHLEFYAAVRGVPQSLIKSQADSLAVSMGLGNFRHLRAGYLSGGNRRRLCLAIALLGDPTVLVIDEASTGVDPQNKRAIWRAVRAMARQDRAVVLTTHSMEEAEALCSRVGILHSGKLLALGTTQQLRSRYGKNYTLDVQLKRNDQLDASSELSNLLNTVFIEHKKLEDFLAWSRFEVALQTTRQDALSHALMALENCNLVESFALYQASLDQIFVGLLDGRSATVEVETAQSGIQYAGGLFRCIVGCGGIGSCGRKRASEEAANA